MNEQRQITFEEALERAMDILGAIRVPVDLIDEIAHPIAHGMNIIRSVRIAMEENKNSEKKEETTEGEETNE